MTATEKQWERLLAEARAKLDAAAKRSEAAQASTWKVAWA